MIEICKRNALLFAQAVCNKRLYDGAPFHPYFDWSDHIATEDGGEYTYHLNKTAEEVIRLAHLFKPHFCAPDEFAAWESDWYRPTVAAAWVHDIGMLDERNLHGQQSAAFLFSGRSDMFDFSGIGRDDLLKIALLCIRHHQAWPTVYNGMKQVLRDHGQDPEQLNAFFNGPDTPIWALEFSGKLIATADASRYRGLDLRNDLKQRFQIWSKCSKCATVYAGAMPFCERNGCGGGKPAPEVAIPVDFPAQEFDPHRVPEIALYRYGGGIHCDRVDAPISSLRLYACVRQANRLFTLGDMALSKVWVSDAQSWRKALRVENIDCTVMDEYLVSSAPDFPEKPIFRTVVHACLDDAYFPEALFTFVTYIARYLEDNLTTDESASWLPSAYTLLNICLPGGRPFVEFIETVKKNGMARLREDTHLDPVVDFERVCKRWHKNKRVVPVEIVGGKVMVIKT